MLEGSWKRALVVSGLVAGVACGGSNDSDLFGSGGSSGASGGSTSTGGTGGGTGGSGGTGVGGSAGQDAGLGGGPSGAGGGVAGEAGSASGGTGGVIEDAGPEYTLANVCQKLAVQTCALRQSCCTSNGYGFSETECEKREAAECKTSVDEVNAGKRSFNPDKIAACLAAVTPLYQKCLFSGEQYVSWLKAVNVCNAIFDSKAGPGSACDTASDCASSSDPNGYSGCGAQSGQCFQATFGQVGDNCNQRVCAEGLTCYFPSFSNTGTCQVKVPVGGACSSSTQCGYGFYCPQVIGTDTCQVAQSGGHSCQSDLHCLSLDCVSGVCVNQGSYVSQALCGT